jgi:hypothetical protein
MASGVAAAMLVLSATPGHAQTDRETGSLDLTLQLGFGGHVGESPSNQVGTGAIELGYRPNSLAFLVRTEFLALSQACTDGLSGGCRYPSVGLLGFSAGIRQSIPVSDRFVPYVGAAGGLYVWTEGSSDPGAAFDLGFAIPTRTRVSLELGARWRTVWRDPSFSVLTGQVGTRIAF